MTTRRLLAWLGLVLIGLAVFSMWPTAGPPVVGNPVAAPTAGERSRPSARPTPAPAEPVELAPASTSVLAPLFPGKGEFSCARPEQVPAGRYRAGDADVLVRDDRTTVWSRSASGAAAVRMLGRWVGDVQWGDGACQWAPTDEVLLSLEVKGGGRHIVAGCPVGEALETDAEGLLEVVVPRGQPCTARVVLGGDALGMGPRVMVAADGPETVSLLPATEALTDTEVAQGIRMLQAMTRQQVQRAHDELDRLSVAGGNVPEAAWLIEAAEAHVVFMEGELDRLESPDEQLDALQDFLYSQSN